MEAVRDHICFNTMTVVGFKSHIVAAVGIGQQAQALIAIATGGWGVHTP